MSDERPASDGAAGQGPTQVPHLGVRDLRRERLDLARSLAGPGADGVLRRRRGADLVVERLAELGGGIVAADALRVLAECPLPIAGLLSDAPLGDVIDQSRACNEAAHGLGWAGATPFLTLAFLALSVIPHLKITDRGLVDVDRFEIVPLQA